MGKLKLPGVVGGINYFIRAGMIVAGLILIIFLVLFGRNAILAVLRRIDYMKIEPYQLPNMLLLPQSERELTGVGKLGYHTLQDLKIIRKWDPWLKKNEMVLFFGAFYGDSVRVIQAYVLGGAYVEGRLSGNAKLVPTYKNIDELRQLLRVGSIVDLFVEYIPSGSALSSSTYRDYLFSRYSSDLTEYITYPFTVGYGDTETSPERIHELLRGRIIELPKGEFRVSHVYVDGGGK